MTHTYTDYPLQHRHTFGMEVKTARWTEYDTAADLAEVLACLPEDERLLHMGAGSNLLFMGDFAGTILHSRIATWEVARQDGEHVWLRVGAGVVWDDLVARCVNLGWGGAENLSLIPGEVGASAVQNIGAYGVEVKDLISEVETMDRHGNPRRFTVDECAYGYRDSIFKQALRGQYIVTHVTYRLDKVPRFRLDYGNIRAELERGGGEVSLQAVRRAVTDIRRSKLPDPKEWGNAGSFFMNPVVERSVYARLHTLYPAMPHYDAGRERVKIPAAWLIEQCGWKGRALGRAGVHARQPLVLVNLGGATGADILRLSNAVCQSVQTKFGIAIRPEVNIIQTNQP